MMDRKLNGTFMTVLKRAILAGAACNPAVIVPGRLGRLRKKISSWTGAAVLLVCAGLWFLSSYKILEQSAAWTVPAVNQTVFRAPGSGLLGLLLTALNHLYFKKREGPAIADYGVKANRLHPGKPCHGGRSATPGYALLFMADLDIPDRLPVPGVRV